MTVRSAGVGSTPSTAFVILNWNSASRTLAVVESLRGWQRLRPLVVIVDNDSRDGSAGLIERSCPGAVLVKLGENRGFGGGCNAGIRKALELGCERICLLNSDAVIDEECATRLLDTLAGDDDIGIAGPLLVEEEEGGESLSAGGRSPAFFPATRITVSGSGTPRTDGGAVRDVDYVPGTVFMAKAAVFEGTGYLEESYFFGGEIAEFCLRTREGGLRCVVDTKVSARHERRDPDEAMDRLRAYYSLRNRFLYVRRNCRPMAIPLTLWWAMTGAAMAGSSLLTGRRGRARALSLGLRDGLVGRWGGGNELFGT